MNHSLNSLIFRSMAFLLLGISSTFAAGTYNYGELLQKALYFYECQQSGKLPSWNRCEWRGPSCVNDGKDAGLDLSGGWYDAGDHIKFNFPMALSTTVLAWGGIAFKDAYIKSGQMDILKRNLRFVTDYFIKCHTKDNELYGQVGDGGSDHAFWGPAESVEAATKRPSFKIDEAHPGSDLAGEVAAALSAVAILLKDNDATYSSMLIAHAKKLYSFADTYRGRYSNSITSAQGYYTSTNGYIDELAWGACWLYLATKDSAYLKKAEADYDSIAAAPLHPVSGDDRTLSWDDKAYGCYILLAQITGKQVYHKETQRFLDFWSVGYKDPVTGNIDKVDYTPGGLAWCSMWGPNRFAANTAFCALVYGDIVQDPTLKKRYFDFGKSQINYMLGDNPNNRSMVVGYGVNPPQKAHHRTSHGVYPSAAQDSSLSLHKLYGALVGGPDIKDAYEDRRDNYFTNEVTCDYNAGFTGAAARLYAEYGGEPLAHFPPPEKRNPEYYVIASVNSSGERTTEIHSVIKNMSRWPARATTNLKFRYYVDLSEVIKAGLSASDVKVSAGYTQYAQTKISQLVNVENDVYYAEFDFTGDTLYPGSYNSYQSEIQFRLSLPDNAGSTVWDPKNDWSYQNLGFGYNDTVIALNMPVYLDDKQVFGAEYNKEPITATTFMAPSVHSTKGLALLNVSVLKNAQRLAIDGSSRQATTLSIYSLSGKLIGQYCLATLPANIGISTIPNGSYVVRLHGLQSGSDVNKMITIQR
ncbi:MAG TPA: glycoside hydrolase family 9 protein [Armatimonadota bacterium]|nr:glycoside hydrolase family 9 protein [Armatimonadota bacterium]